MLFGDIQNLAHDWALELIWENGSWKDEKRPSELLLRERESDRQGFFKTVRTQIENTLGEVSPQYETLITAEENDLALRVAAYGLADQILNGNPNLGPNHIALYGRSTNGTAMRVYTMNYAREIMNDPESYNLYGSASAMDMDAVRKRYEEMLNDPLVQEAENAPESRTVTLEDDIAFEITYGGDRFDADDVAVAVGPVTREGMAAMRQRIVDAAMALYPQQGRDFVERQADAWLSKVEVVGREPERDDGVEAPAAWARYDADGYEVSTAGDARFSAMNARFAQGTSLGAVDVSGMTVEEVYQNVVKRSGKGLPPAAGTVAYNPDLHTDREKEDYTYANGYLPLWTIWARQNPRLVSELRRKAAGRPLTDKFAATSVTQARALADIIRGNGAEFSGEELERYFSKGERLPSHPSLTPERLDGYDVYSVGLGRAEKADFFAMLPPDTDVVVDMRNYRINSHAEHFDYRNLVPSLEAQGLEYVWLKDLSGRGRVPGARIGGTDRDPLVDYGAYAASPAFREALDQVKALVVGGKKVCIIGGGTDAAYDPRALLVGQELERTTNLRIAHVDDRSRDGSMRIRSQEEVVQAAIGRRAEIVGGDYLSLTFRSDRSYSLEGGVAVKEHDVARASAADRTISGNWNYANRIDIMEDGSARGPVRAFSSPYRDTMAANAEWADHTLVFAASPSDREANEAASVAHDFTRIALYSKDGSVSREDLEDPERIARAAQRIEERVSRSLVYRMRHGAAVEDLMSLKINVAGSNMARIANTFVDDPVTEEEIGGRARRVLDRTGLKLDDQTGVGQEDVNRFVEAVLRKVAEDAKTFGGEGEERPWNIGHIRTNGQTGVAEAASLAAQSLGIEGSILAPKGWLHTIDNETMRGMDVPDEAMFKNRFHQGLRHDVTMQNLQEQIETLDRRRMEREDGMQTGLTDRQVLVLYELGFDNGSIVDMIELARDNRVSVNGPADMAEFIANAAGYGIPGTKDVDEAMVDDAFRRAAEKQARWMEDGITFVTAASPYYPDNLRRFREEIRTEYVLEPRNVDGEVMNIPVPVSVVVRRPALLWAKGDLSLLDAPAVSVAGSVSTSNDAAGAARLLGSALSEADMPAVVSLSEGVGAEVAREAAMRGGRVVAVSGDGIVTEDRLARIDREIGEVNERMGQISEADDEYDELLARRDGLFAERVEAERESLEDPQQRVLQDDVVRKGGLVLSESEPGARAKKGSDRSRADKVSAALGYGCAVIDAAFSRNTTPMSPVAMAAYTLYGIYRFAYKAVQAASGDDAKAVKEGAGARDGKVITPSGEGFGEMVDEVREAYDASFREVPQERAAVAEGVAPEEDAAVAEDGPRAERIPSFFEYFFSGKDAQEEAEKAAAEETTAPAAELRQAPVRVVEYGGDRVYLVPDGQPRIVAALRGRFGDGVRIAPLSSEGAILRRLSHASVVVDGEEVPRFTGYAGTQVRVREPRTETLYFYRDRIYDLADVPNGTLGLEPKDVRERSAALWEDLLRGARGLQREFQRAAGVDADAQVRFENADHLRVGTTSVDVLRGDELRARVWLTDRGEICKRNFGRIASEDFQEYHETPAFDIFSDTDRVIAPEDVAHVLDEVRQALWERPALEVREEMESNLDRERREERREHLENAFLVPRADNLEIAVQDVAEARSHGLLPDPDALAAADRVALFAMAEKTAAADAKKAASAAREIDKVAKKISALPQGDEHEAERTTLEDSMDRLVAERQSLFAEMADMEDLRRDLAHGRDVSVASRAGKTMTLSLDGRMFTLRTKPLSEEDRRKAVAALEEYEARDGIHAEPPKEGREPSPTPSLTFSESAGGDYKSRTVENAQEADVTVAMAVDFSTYGERATEKAAGDRYISVAMDAAALSGDPVREGRLAAAAVAAALREKGLLKEGGISINFAGNGLYTLEGRGVTQEAADGYATALLSSLMHDHGVKVTSVRSGGQTGMDEAGAKAGVANGVDTVVHAPKGWRMRGADGTDVAGEAAFKERFGVPAGEPVEAPVEAAGRTADDRIAELGKWLAEAERDPLLRETTEYAERREEVQRLLERKKEGEGKARRAPRGLPQGVRALTDFDRNNGVCVVGREDGRKAYADRQLRVISDWYEELTPMGRTFGTAKRADGCFKFVDATGREVVPRWMEGVSRSVEGMNMVKVDGRYNFLDLERGELVSQTDFVRASNFHEGFAIVQDDAGKYNYLRKDGSVLCNSWLDSATEFSGGLATVTLDGNAYRIGDDGAVREVLGNERDKGRGNGGSKID